MSIVSSSTWREFIAAHPNAHILQSEEWARLKADFGWSPIFVINGANGAQVLFKKLPLGLSVAYIPRGPIGLDFENLWSEIDNLCHQKKAVFLRVEPDIYQPTDQTFSDKMSAFLPDARTVQPPRSILISLEGGENEWLERMKQKTRYNIRLAEKKEVVVTPSNDIDEFHRLMLVTGGRDGFGVHSREYYQRAFDLFHDDGRCELLVARYREKPLAALMVFACGTTSYYLYGASSDEERNRMPTYLLQWEAMRWSASHGCTSYDLWGIPDEDEETLEAGFTSRSDGLWGVYRFKRGYGGKMVRTVGAWDKIYNPLLYKMYQLYMRGRSL
ncbi:MAG: peptidoglycan bridge formation glycyltransferase FemA/FemB family protein [Anaerolineae bacterium]|nr:peptidoglycan bridge formation glycyltransferase FemA/FemB family protein [Anaerolineae bacterium]